MFRIGEFSKMNRVSIKTLRYYDEIGLLKPTKVDEWTNYRLYSSEKIEEFHRIITLKQIGFSIAEIKNVFQDKLGTKKLITFLSIKKKEAEIRAREEEAMAKRIEYYINDLKKEKEMNNNVIIKELPGVVIASMRRVIPSYDEFNSFYPEMGELMKKHGVKCAMPEYCFTLYHEEGYKERDIDVEICQAVDKMYESKDGVVYKEIPKVEAACILHKGPYNTIGKSYGVVMEWIEKNGYKVADNPRESYIDGIWNKDNPEDWLTEIQVPIEKK